MSAPGWHADPTGAHEHRWWDGTSWTEHVADGGVGSVDPLQFGPIRPKRPTPAEVERAMPEWERIVTVTRATPAGTDPAAPRYLLAIGATQLWIFALESPLRVAAWMPLNGIREVSLTTDAEGLRWLAWNLPEEDWSTTLVDDDGDGFVDLLRAAAGPEGRLPDEDGPAARLAELRQMGLLLPTEYHLRRAELETS